MNEELRAELDAFRRLIEAIQHDIARLSRQSRIIEKVAQERPPEDGDAAFERGEMALRKGRHTIDHGRGRLTRDDDNGSD